MLVLGVDSGTISTGYGFVGQRGSRLFAIDFGAIRNKPGTPQPERLFAIQERLQALIRLHHPDRLALESVFVSKNARSALVLGQVRGVVMATAIGEGVAVQEYAPNQVKMAVCGYGHAEKGQVQNMVKVILGLQAIPKPNDASDALALAICAILRETFTSKIAECGAGQ